MKINRLETHDRLLDFQKQSNQVSEFIQKELDNPRFGHRMVFIYAISQTKADVEEGKSGKAITYQVRLTKPIPAPNTMLFKIRPPFQSVEVVWILPDDRHWDSYEPGKMFYNDVIWDSIQMFQTNYQEMARPDKEEPSDEEARRLYKGLPSLKAKPKILAASPTDLLV